MTKIHLTAVVLGKNIDRVSVIASQNASVYMARCGQKNPDHLAYTKEAAINCSKEFGFEICKKCFKD